MNNFDLAMPMLSRGKHRNPRKGACFMEFASYLAGEPWSDHPSCTHPLLAAVARDVNDCTTDANRNRLAPLIPSVIGLTADDPRLSARITTKALWIALPVVSQERQHILAVALLVSEQLLAELEGRPANSMQAKSASALAQVPAAARWARSFTARPHRGRPDYTKRTAPRAIACAVEGIAQACIPNPDDLLYEVLAGAIAECEALRKPAPVQAPSRQESPVRS